MSDPTRPFHIICLKPYKSYNSVECVTHFFNSGIFIVIGFGVKIKIPHLDYLIVGNNLVGYTEVRVFMFQIKQVILYSEF